MTVTETSVQSWGSRLGSSFSGILLGLVLTLVAIGILFWNEKRTVSTARALAEGASNVVAVDAGTVDPANEGKLVCVAGDVSTDETTTDPQFGVSVVAISLARNVQMYQWIEETEEKTERGPNGSEVTTTTYKYKKAWSLTPIDSSQFKESGRDNPGAFPVEGAYFAAKNVKLGAFQLSDDLIGKLGPSEPFDPPKAKPAEEAKTADEAKPAETAAPSPDPNAFHPIPNGFYLGADPNSPQIGDVRVEYSIVSSPRKATVAARQNGDSFVPYQAKAGAVELLENQIVSAEQIFANAQSSNATTAWIFRIVGFAVMFFGIASIFKPLAVVADFVPILGRIVGAGTSAVAFGLSLAGSLTTIAFAWLFYRPLLGVPLLVGAVCAIVWLVAKAKKRSSKNV